MVKKVVVNGAGGRMGQEVVRTIVQETDDKLVGACDPHYEDESLSKMVGLQGGKELKINADLRKTIKNTKPDVVIDFTTPQVVIENIKTTLQEGVNIIVGTTGITEVDLRNIAGWCEKYDANALIVPNFALGAVLMMRLASEAAKYLPDVEVIELHHDQKVDAPSGTSLKTAELINEMRREKTGKKVEEIENLKGARGGESNGVRIHSVRLPGLVAHQEVIFGTEGQSLTIRHDSYNRRSFMPGVKLALKKINEINGLVYGLEKILD